MGPRAAGGAGHYAHGAPGALVQTTSASLHVPYAALVLHVPRHDPLLHHMALVLQAAVDAEDVAGGLYAEALANALAVHRARGPRQASRSTVARRAPPSKLHGATAYIRAHLERTLSLAELAAVAQMSPAHFARLFKGAATGQTPHQYVTTCRMERAKHLLTETTLPSMRSAPRSATPISHFTALFRQSVATTPRRTATLPPGRECGGAPPEVPCGGRSRRGGCPPAAVYVRVGVSALSRHDFRTWFQHI